MTESALRSLPLAEIVEGCQQEQRRSRLAEIGHCFELFRRAIEQRDEVALRSLQLQYGRLVLRWVYDRLPDATDAQVEDVADKSFLKFQGTLSRRAPDVAAHFDHVGKLLSYLKQCVSSSAIDHLRSEARRAKVERLLAVREQSLAEGRLEEAAQDRIDQAILLRRVVDWIGKAVTDPLERMVIELTYSQDQSPRLIAAQHPDKFADESAVNRIKERVLKRARRALVDEAETGTVVTSVKRPARR